MHAYFVSPRLPGPAEAGRGAMRHRGEALDDYVSVARCSRTVCERVRWRRILRPARPHGCMVEIERNAGCSSNGIYPVTSNYTSAVDEAVATHRVADSIPLRSTAAMRGVLQGSRLMAFENHALQERWELTRAELRRFARGSRPSGGPKSLTDALTGVAKPARLRPEARVALRRGSRHRFADDRYRSFQGESMTLDGHVFGDQVLRLIGSDDRRNERAPRSILWRGSAKEFTLVMEGAS